jgi:ribosome-binding factor A
VLARAKQQDEEVAARRVEAYAGEPDPYKKPRAAEDDLEDEDDDPDRLDDALDDEDDRS